MTRRETILRLFDENRTFIDARQRSGTELYRKGSALLAVRTADGGPLPNDVTVELRQTSHAFRFGANLFMLDEFETPEKSAAYRKLFPKLFNLATLPFYWGDMEPEPGNVIWGHDEPHKYRRPTPDRCIEYCRAAGIEPKLHCLNYDSFLPKWLWNTSPREVKATLSKRFREIAARYADKIPMVEVTNETFIPDPEMSSYFLDEEFVECSFREARRCFPHNRLIINEANV
ncbi:MAG: endo-1,4-beta-xylanase, partial [Clostridia bacterium]|nr:endo-1,4-beta-xylanase [Clostridia bacterium]